MCTKTIVKICVDAGMTVMLLFLMAYEITEGEAKIDYEPVR